MRFSCVRNPRNHHAHHDHQKRRKHRSRKQVQRLQGRQRRDSLGLEKVIEPHGQEKGQGVRITHLQQVYESRIPHNPGISPENPRPDQAQEGQEDYRVEHVEPMLIRHPRPMKHPIHERTGHEHDHRIRQHDAPVRQRILAEVPLGRFLQPVLQTILIHMVSIIYLSFLESGWARRNLLIRSATPAREDESHQRGATHPSPGNNDFRSG